MAVAGAGADIMGMAEPNDPLPADDAAKWRWILSTGWRGRCPRCGKGHMFSSWLKVAPRCEVCDLDYRFAAPDDGPAFFSLCIIAFPLAFVIVWLEVAFNPRW